MQYYKRLKPFRCISFDLDDTLWNNGPVIEQAERAQQRFIQDNYPCLSHVYSPAYFSQIRAQQIAKYPHLLCDLTELRLQTLTCLFNLHGLDAQAAQATFNVFYAARQQITPFPKVRTLLETLSAQYPLIALSNGNSNLAACDLHHFFQHDIRAFTLKLRKPDPSFYQAAAKQAGFQPCEILHIGDHFHYDAVAAIRAGWQSMWFNPHQIPIPKGTAQQLPNAQIHTLHELTALLTN